MELTTALIVAFSISGLILLLYFTVEIVRAEGDVNYARLVMGVTSPPPGVHRSSKLAKAQLCRKSGDHRYYSAALRSSGCSR